MAMLHIIRSSGYNNNALAQCLNMLLPNDSILLMDDGCYNVNHKLLLKAQLAAPELKIFFIEQHANARAQKNIAQAFSPTTLTDVVNLLFQHDNSITWS